MKLFAGNLKCLVFLINDRIIIAYYQKRLEAVVQNSCCYEIVRVNPKNNHGGCLF